MKNKLCIGLIAAASGAYLLHRLGLRWGATDAEVHRPLPGDDIVPHPMLETTHAITIRAPRSAIWPWLVQMGYHRAGWYTDSWYLLVDKYVFQIERPLSSDHILPQFQHLEVGDTVPDGPPGMPFFTVAELEPQRALVLYSTTHLSSFAPRSLRNNPKVGIYGNFSWAFVLDEVDESTTRLILRTRANSGPRLFTMLNNLLLPPADFVIVRLMLRTIKQRVEHAQETAPRESKQSETVVQSTQV
ncbi:MAG TPA: hypothetical protein VF844_02330 [Ktedonobacteraceae bacterium]